MIPKTIQKIQGEVVLAIQDAFQPAQIEDHLEPYGDRVFGSVTVIGSPTFDALNDKYRQQSLWQHLSERLGTQATQVGPIVLEPTKNG